MIRRASLAALGLVVALCGCVNVTTRATNSARTGTEQLLLSGATDRAIGSIDFGPLAGHVVFLEPTATGAAAPDADWINFSLRRAMARQGVLLAADKAGAQTVVEAAIGAYGTDEAEKRISMPNVFSVSMLLPVPLPAGGASSESAFYRRQRQNSVVKLALFAYDATSRQLVWESITAIGQGDLDRRFLGTNNLTRDTNEPVLQSYPPRGVLR